VAKGPGGDGELAIGWAIRTQAILVVMIPVTKTNQQCNDTRDQDKSTIM
jgi:hypothetical protein